MVIINETIADNSSEEHDAPLFAGQVLLIFYCLIFIFGFIGNSMVIYVAIRKKNYRNVTNCYVINLAIADLLFLTLSIPYTTYLGVKNSYPFGNIVCKIYTYLAYGFLQATCNILAMMSIDRFLYIVRPKSKLRWRTPHNAFIICIIIWACSLILIIPYHVVSRVLTSASIACGMAEHENLIVCLFPFCSYYAIPLIVIIVCYTNLALHVIRTSRKMADIVNTKSFHQTVQLKQRRVTRMYLPVSEAKKEMINSCVKWRDKVIVVTLAFAICWLPIHILELMKCGNPQLLNSLIQLYPKVLYSIRGFTHALAYLNSCLNPYLYALLNRNFCIDLADIVPSWMSCSKKLVTIENEHFNNDPQLSRAILSGNQIFISKKYHDHDEDDTDYYEQNQTTNDASCQVELH
ncbi:unnamed protein product [Rotaria sordida]|uniref:G-protein coupled receptors family 1 profile domain-containing protein n=1 Tax=Rotaria sordida TaxID=392033 RepID=A0A813NEP9_9BILA|nr:unnamed protein product [Rotaria sordida]